MTNKEKDCQWIIDIAILEKCVKHLTVYSPSGSYSGKEETEPYISMAEQTLEKMRGLLE